MTWEDAFGLSGTLALAGWALLLFGPRRDWLLAVAGIGIPAVLALSYALLVLTQFSSATGDFNSLAGVRSLFQSDPALLAGWQHYLAYDLFVGAWIVRRLHAADIGRVLQWPVLGACFLFGPMGFLMGLALEFGTKAARILIERLPALPAPIHAEVA